jgi:hypothetical protein
LQPTVKIAVAVSLTGASNVLGVPAPDGARLAVDEANVEGLGPTSTSRRLTTPATPTSATAPGSAGNRITSRYWAISPPSSRSTRCGLLSAPPAPQPPCRRGERQSTPISNRSMAPSTRLTA